MRRFLLVPSVLLALLFAAYPTRSTVSDLAYASDPSKPKVYVHGYYRKDGTYVPPHYRSAPSTSHPTTPKKPSSGTTASPGTTSVPRTTTSPHATTSPHSGRCTTCPRDENGRIKRSSAARSEFMRQTGYPHGRPGYVVDHIVPLECGGADSPGNMQWQAIADAKVKDRTERNCRH